MLLNITERERGREREKEREGKTNRQVGRQTDRNRDKERKYACYDRSSCVLPDMMLVQAAKIH